MALGRTEIRELRIHRDADGAPRTVVVRLLIEDADTGQGLDATVSLSQVDQIDRAFDPRTGEVDATGLRRLLAPHVNKRYREWRAALDGPRPTVEVFEGVDLDPILGEDHSV